MRDDSKCPKRKYCAFEQKFEDETGIGEVCMYCGKKVWYGKNEEGEIHNDKYLADHVRDFCQPTGRTAKIFYEIYGKSGIENVERAKEYYKKAEEKKKTKDLREELRDRRKFLKRMSAGHKYSDRDWETFSIPDLP